MRRTTTPLSEASNNILWLFSCFQKRYEKDFLNRGGQAALRVGRNWGGGLFGEEPQTGISRAFRDILFSPIITGISS